MKKKYTIGTLFLLFLFGSNQQISSQNFKELDSSPHDIVYYRANKISPPSIKVLYGRPQKRGRKIFGELIPYGEVWRVGANEASEIRFYQDVIFGNKKVKAGTYVIYAIPQEKEWTLVLSSNLDVWGAYEYEKKYDVARAKAKVKRAEDLEAFSIGFKHKGNHVNMVLGWDITRVTVPITLEN